MPATTTANVLDTFIRQWGALGSQWGVNRTMAMIHACLLGASRPLSTDDIMALIGVSRGNANTNLRELVDWSLVYRVVVPGERKEFFEAEKDVWKIFCAVARERKRRETEPALTVLQSCADQAAQLKDPEAKELHRQLAALADFLSLANTVMEKIASADQSRVLPRLLKLL
ncbi:MAG: transcriptional regulator [Puniceicoccaceae bacterium]|nr:MAG: transcriptional regulator [Puniceicoccaceae bacterium]